MFVSYWRPGTCHYFVFDGRIGPCCCVITSSYKRHIIGVFSPTGPTAHGIFSRQISHNLSCYTACVKDNPAIDAGMHRLNVAFFLRKCSAPKSAERVLGYRFGSFPL